MSKKKPGFDMSVYTDELILFYQRIEDDEDRERAKAAKAVHDGQAEKCINSAPGGCRRNRKDQCCHSMCFPCCLAQCKGASTAVDGEEPGSSFSSSSSSSSSLSLLSSSYPCQVHLPELQAKEAEDRYFEEGFTALHGTTSNSHRKKTKFYHYESQFSKHGETIVIWCLKDFVRNREFSEATFKLYHDAERRKRNRLRREGGDSLLVGNDSAEANDSYSLASGSQLAAAQEQGRQRFEAWVATESERRQQGQEVVDCTWLNKFEKNEKNAVKAGGGARKR